MAQGAMELLIGQYLTIVEGIFNSCYVLILQLLEDVVDWHVCFLCNV